jgi:hypothetical protein
VVAAYGREHLNYEDLKQPGSFSDFDSAYTYYPGDASPWCRISFSIKGGVVAQIDINGSVY